MPWLLTPRATGSLPREQRVLHEVDARVLVDGRALRDVDLDGQLGDALRVDEVALRVVDLEVEDPPPRAQPARVVEHLLLEPHARRGVHPRLAVAAVAEPDLGH